MSVTTKCNGQVTVWENADTAIGYFETLILQSCGRERNKYINVWSDLKRGLIYATDKRSEHKAEYIDY